MLQHVLPNLKLLVFLLDSVFCFENRAMEVSDLLIISSARNGALGPTEEWKLKDCIAVHKLLGTVLVDHDAALSKYK